MSVNRLVRPSMSTFRLARGQRPVRVGGIETSGSRTVGYISSVGAFFQLGVNLFVPLHEPHLVETLLGQSAGTGGKPAPAFFRLINGAGQRAHVACHGQARSSAGD